MEIGPETRNGTSRATRTDVEGGRPDVHEQGRRAEDRDLVLAFQDGSRDAFVHIYRRYRRRVGAVCTRMLHHDEDVEEAVQETFLRAYQALGRFNGDYQVGAWLTRIATNVCVDLLRSRSRHTPLVLLPWLDHDLPDNSENVEETLTGRDPRVNEAIRRIQPLHARALKLRAVDGLSHAEMAGQLSMTPSQVKALLHRARRSFKRAFERAGSWLVAPVAGVRSLLHRGRETAGDPFVAAAGPACTTLAERAATGVVIAVIAVGVVPVALPGGTPTTTSGAPLVPPQAMPAAENDAVTGALRAEIEADEANAGSKGDETPSSPQFALLERARKVADATSRPPRARPRPPEEGDGEEIELPGTPSATDAERLAKKVQKKAASVLERNEE